MAVGTFRITFPPFNADLLLREELVMDPSFGIKKQ
jgi:hypothetical protein